MFEFRIRGRASEVDQAVERIRTVFDVVSVSRPYEDRKPAHPGQARVYVQAKLPDPPVEDAQQRPAELGELCTCGRQAVLVFLGGPHGDTGYCGLPDGGQRGRCRFCGGNRHQGQRCPRYVLRPGRGEVTD